MLADLELGQRLDGDLRHSHPEPVLGLVVFCLPYAIGLAVDADMARLAEWVGGAADCTSRVRADPVLGLFEQNAVADLVAKHLGQGRWTVGVSGIGPAMSLREALLVDAMVGRRPSGVLGGVELVAPAADQELGLLGQAQSG